MPISARTTGKSYQVVFSTTRALAESFPQVGASLKAPIINTSVAAKSGRSDGNRSADIVRRTVPDGEHDRADDSRWAGLLYRLAPVSVTLNLQQGIGRFRLDRPAHLRK